jgi:hypothetical protein
MASPRARAASIRKRPVGLRADRFNQAPQFEAPLARFIGDMQRQVFWWDHPKLPELSDLNRLAELDGILVDSPCSTEHLKAWQDLFLPTCRRIPDHRFCRRVLAAALAAVDRIRIILPRRIRGQLIGEPDSDERVSEAGNHTPCCQGVRLSWKMWLEMTMR